MEEEVIYFNPFEGWSEERLKAFVSNNRGKHMQALWEGRSDEEKGKYLKASFHSDEAKAKSQEASRQIWKDKSSEEIEAHVLVSFHSPEAFKKSGETRAKDYADKTDEEKRGFSIRSKESVNKFWNSPEGEEARKFLSIKASTNWASKTEEEKESWLKSSIHKEGHWSKGIAAMQEGYKRWWIGLSGEEKAVVEAKRHTEEAKLHVVQGNQKKPNIPESIVGSILEEVVPGRFKYNGDGSQGVILGGKTPDYISVEYREIVEVFGDYWHRFDSEEDWIKNYERFGYRCLVIWEYEIYGGDAWGKVEGFCELGKEVANVCLQS